MPHRLRLLYSLRRKDRQGSCPEQNSGKEKHLRILPTVFFLASGIRLLGKCAAAVVLPAWLLLAAPSPAAIDQPERIQPPTRPFQPGETLIYSVSWSTLVTAGVLTTEVLADRLPDGREGLVFAVTGNSVGLLDAVYPVHDTVRSLFDPQGMVSLSYRLNEKYGKRKRRKEVDFDRAKNTVVLRLNDDQPETSSVPENTLDGLSLLYVVRAHQDFSEGKIFSVPVYDSSKLWSIEIHTLGRERVTTPAGEFSTIKIKTYPTYQGVFQNKGVVFIWLTDDTRKIPVLAKSTLKVGSFVITLTAIKPEAGGKPAGP
jgi:hypothetical protein